MVVARIDGYELWIASDRPFSARQMEELKDPVKYLYMHLFECFNKNGVMIDRGC